MPAATFTAISGQVGVLLHLQHHSRLGSDPLLNIQTGIVTTSLEDKRWSLRPSTSLQERLTIRR